jgi:aldose 1-epimerase
MIRLASGSWAAALLAGQGAAFASLTCGGRDVLAPIPAGADPNAGFHGAFLMAPWTNRLGGGRIVVGGVEYRMPINRPAEGNALHGLLRDRAWTVAAQQPDRAVLSCALDHAPFRCAARLEVALSAAGLALDLTVRNTGDAPTPIGLGWHPWFARPAGTRLDATATTAFGRDAGGIATAPAPSGGLHGGDAALDGHDTHFAGWDGAATIAWPDGTGFVLTARGAWARNLQVYAPKGGGVLCVEPVSHVPDAANRADNAAHGAMPALAPGAEITASLTLHRA